MKWKVKPITLDEWFQLFEDCFRQNATGPKTRMPANAVWAAALQEIQKLRKVAETGSTVRAAMLSEVQSQVVLRQAILDYIADQFPSVWNHHQVVSFRRGPK